MPNLPDIFTNSTNSSNNKKSPLGVMNDSGTKSCSENGAMCEECIEDLMLPLSEKNSQIFENIKERYLKLKNVEEHLVRKKVQRYSGSLNLQETAFVFGRDVGLHKPQYLQTHDYPLISQSKLIYEQKLMDWKTVHDHRMPNKTQKFHILRFSTQQNATYKKDRPRRLPQLAANQHLGKLSKFLGSNKSEHEVLRAEPKTMLFYGFQMGCSYKKKLKLTNLATTTCTFTLCPLPASSQFKVKSSHLILVLAAGMSVKVTVEFLCHSLADVTEQLVLNVHDSQNLVIPLQATSPPPHLIETDHEVCHFSSENKMVSLIDCGSILVGEEYQVNITLKNIGSCARFCFISETDWFTMEYEINSSNRLHVGSFVVEPMLFLLDKDQAINVSVTFKAPSEGLHTNHVFLLCGNTSLKRVDFTGDGFLYDPSWIHPVGMLKTFDVDIPDFKNTECYLDFGKMLVSSTSYICFLIHNGEVSLSYHWEVRPATIPGFNSLTTEALKIFPVSSRISPKAVQTFFVLCDTSSVPPGNYRMLLMLIVDEIPIKSIPFDIHEKIIQFNEEENEVQSIEGTLIEVWLECVEPNIILLPFMIDFGYMPLVCGSLKETREVIVLNQSPGIINLVWFSEDESPQIKLEIQPKQFDCKEFSSTTCFLSVEAVKEGSFLVVYKCVSDKGVWVDLHVQGKCFPNKPKAETNQLDFGFVMYKSNQVASVLSTNCSVIENTPWTIKELWFSEEEEHKQLEFSETFGLLSSNEGQFCHRGSEVLVLYHLNTEEERIWCSLLDWNGAYVPVLADVCQPDVSLSYQLLQPETLYKGVCCHLSLSVQNHTVLDTAIFWGNPSNNSVSVEVTPRFAVLKPDQELFTQIFLVPNTEGPLKFVYLPCFVEQHIQPLLLKVEGFVKGLRVRVQWETGTEHNCIFWPPGSQTDNTKTLDSISLNSIICHSPPNSQESFTTDYGDSKSTGLSNEYCGDAPSYDDSGKHRKAENNHMSDSYFINCKTEPSNVNNVLVDVFVNSGEKNFPSNKNDSGNLSEASSIPYLNWPIVGGKYTRNPMSDEMERHFEDLFSWDESKPYSESQDTFKQQETLCFHDIPTGTGVSQVIYIKNDSMICSYYEACVVNNFERPEKTIVVCDPEETEKNIRKQCIKGGDWHKRASKERGLTVFVEPAQGQLPAQDYVSLQVTVYAISWGHYTDALILQLGDLEQLCLKLSIRVSQPPLSVPPVLRFGAVSVNSSSEHHVLRIQNTSTVPLYICWQLFSPNSEPLPFSAMLCDGNPFQFHLTSYYGSFTSPHFQISKMYTFIAPFSQEAVEVEFSPKHSNVNAVNGILLKKFEATLIGYVHLTDQARYTTNTESCIRADGMKLEPLKISLEAFVELPVLTLLNVFNYQLIFKCTTYDVMCSKEKVWSKEKVITVKNESSLELRAEVTTFGHFFISRIKYPCVTRCETISNFTKGIFLQPGQTCEVSIECRVTQDTLYECFEEEEMLSPETEIQTGIVECGLVSFVQNHIRQDVNLELWLYQPLLHLSVMALNFGLVYLEDTKTLIVTISAPLGRDIFNTSIKSGDNIFCVNASSGMLEPHSSFSLQVSFTPRACVTYRDILIVQSCLDRIFWEIPLSGVGTFNYKNHLY